MHQRNLKRIRLGKFFIASCIICETALLLYAAALGTNTGYFHFKVTDELPTAHTIEDTCSAIDVQYEGCIDSRLAADPSESTISMKGDPVVVLGDQIKFTVKLFDGFKTPKSTGGDYIRARMWSTDVEASSAGSVYDNQDGTYTVVYDALWTGNISLEVELLYPKEVISAVHRTRNVVYRSKCAYTSQIMTNFKRNSCFTTAQLKHKRHTLEKEQLLCNITSYGRSDTLHCFKAKHERQTCAKWKNSIQNCWRSNHPISECEEELVERRHFNIGGTHNVTVISSNTREHVVGTPDLPCPKYDTTKLWLSEMPTGFFYQGKWLLRHCKGDVTDIGKCLQNNTILFHGDSTLYHWRRYIWKHVSFKCITVDKGQKPVFDYQDWHDTLHCYCEKHNITFIWVPCLTTGELRLTSLYKQKLIQNLNLVDKRYKLSVVVTIFLHFYHLEYGLFKAHMSIIRTNFEKILETFPSSKLFIKMPHTHRPFDLALIEKNTMILHSDYVGFVYSCIIRDVFKGMYDKVVPLNHRDVTTAVKNVYSHPLEFIVESMVKQLVSYIC